MAGKSCLGHHGCILTPVSFGRSSQLTVWNTPLTLKAHVADALGCMEWVNGHGNITSWPSRSKAAVRCIAFSYKEAVLQAFFATVDHLVWCSCLLLHYGLMRLSSHESHEIIDQHKQADCLFQVILSWTSLIKQWLCSNQVRIQQKLAWYYHPHTKQPSGCHTQFDCLWWWKCTY